MISVRPQGLTSSLDPLGSARVRLHRITPSLFILDFSELSSADSKNQHEQIFNYYCNRRLIETASLYSEYLPNMPDIRMDDSASQNLSTFLGHVKTSGAPPVYVIIDEYDNFVNQLITRHDDHLYYQITSGIVSSGPITKFSKQADKPVQ